MMSETITQRWWFDWRVGLLMSELMCMVVGMMMFIAAMVIDDLSLSNTLLVWTVICISATYLLSGYTDEMCYSQ